MVTATPNGRTLWRGSLANNRTVTEVPTRGTELTRTASMNRHGRTLGDEVTGTSRLRRTLDQPRSSNRTSAWQDRNSAADWHPVLKFGAPDRNWTADTVAGTGRREAGRAGFDTGVAVASLRAFEVPRPPKPFGSQRFKGATEAIRTGNEHTEPCASAFRRPGPAAQAGRTATGTGHGAYLSSFRHRFRQGRGAGQGGDGLTRADRRAVNGMAREQSRSPAARAGRTHQRPATSRTAPAGKSGEGRRG